MNNKNNNEINNKKKFIALPNFHYNGHGSVGDNLEALGYEIIYYGSACFDYIPYYNYIPDCGYYNFNEEKFKKILSDHPELEGGNYDRNTIFCEEAAKDDYFKLVQVAIYS